MPKKLKKSTKKTVKRGVKKAVKVKKVKKPKSTLVWKRTKSGRPKSATPKRTVKKAVAKKKRTSPVVSKPLLTQHEIPVINGGEIKVSESKFHLGVSENAGEFQAHNLPFDYGHNRVILLVVDPKFVFVYWEVQNDKMREAINNIGPNAKLTLRFRNLDSGRSWDISIYERVGNWYLKLDHPGQNLTLTIGMKNDRGDFFQIASSGTMRLPRMGLAPKSPIKWMLVSPTGEKVITEIEEYTDADLELLKKIMGPYFFDLLKRERFAGISGSSAENIFMNLEEIVPIGISS